MITARFDDRRIATALRRIADRGGSLSAPLNSCGEVLLASIDKNFEAEGRYSSPGDIRGGSSRWKPLAASTRLQRIGGSRAFTKKGGLRKNAQRKLEGMKILQRSQGGLASSFTKQVSGNTLTVGSNKTYAAIHHYGGLAGRGRRVTIPARPFLVVQDEDIEDMLDITEKHLGG